MADEKQSGAGFGGGGSIILFLVAAASAAYVGWQAPPLVSSRPTDADYRIHEIRGTQDIDARLWQDPFAAVMRVVEGEPKPGANEAKRHSREDLLRPLEDHPALALAVALPGAPYPEAAETRRRLRYAVLAALHVASYAPEDEKHIGYWRTGDEPDQKPDDQKPAGPVYTSATQIGQIACGAPRRDGVADPAAAGAAEQKCLVRDSGSRAALPPVIPFEWFDAIDAAAGPQQRETNTRKRVVVLWLDEDFLTVGRRPIAALDRLASTLQPSTCAARPDVQFALVGPQDSTMLMAMAIEARRRREQPVNGKCGAKPPLPDVPRYSVYNFGATAEHRKILSASGAGEADTMEAQFAAAGLRYFRTVGSDGDLAGPLMQELRRRGVDPHADTTSGLHHDHIALVSEWDTVYGQSLRDSVSDAFETAAGKDDVGRSGPADWVERYSYLRGLDGRLPDPQWAKKRKSSDNDDGGQKPGEPTSATPDNTKKFESAEGQSQFDYLRRLAAAIKLRDDELRRSGEGRIAAIGVLGSDVYDKLLILQALRPELPEALFFTTDLDALLLPQEKSRYTRNLLVASSYGLSLRPEAQTDIPPFRSTYQSSIFLATRLALRNEWSGVPPDNAESQTRSALQRWLSQPLLFQIGRSAARALPSGSEEPSYDAGAPRHAKVENPRADIVDYPTVQPRIAELYPTFGSPALFGAGLLLTALLLAAMFGSRTVRQNYFPRMAQTGSSPPPVQPRVGSLILLCLSVATASILLCLAWPLIGPLLTQGRLGEPMALFEGISVWPTIAMRTTGFGLSLWLIWCTLHSLKTNRDNTAEEMGYPARVRTFAQQRHELGPRQGSKVGWWATVLISLLWLAPQTSRDSRRPKISFNEIGGGSSANLPARCIRAAAGTVAMALVWWLMLAPIFGDPNAPARGSLAHSIYMGATLADVFATLFLMFLVADATLYSRAFIKRLTAVATDWPEETIIRFTGRFQMKPADLYDWLDMQLMAKRTSCITRLIYFPFISLAILVASRSRLFDDFSMPSTLAIAQAISLAVVIGSVLALRVSAENARSVARENLTAKIIAAKGEEKNQLQMMLNEVENLKEGALAPWSSQPVVKAVLLPLLTYGGGMLVHLYALPGT